MTRTLGLHPIPAAAVAVLLLASRRSPRRKPRRPPVPSRELVITPSELTLEVGSTATLEAEVRDADGNVMDRPWSSSRAAAARSA